MPTTADVNVAVADAASQDSLNTSFTAVSKAFSVLSPNDTKEGLTREEKQQQMDAGIEMSDLPKMWDDYTARDGQFQTRLLEGGV